MNQLQNVLFFGILSGVATILGVLFVLYFEKQARKYSIYLISFAAGVLITAAFVSLIPQSMEMSRNSPIFVLFGFLLFYLIENLVLFHSCKEKNCRSRNHAFSKIAFFGLAFHSLLDGMIIGIGFEVSVKIGIIATLGVLLHEIPEGIMSMSIFFYSNVKKSLALAYSLIIAVATPIGAILTYLAIKNINIGFIGMLLALAAGSFIYISGSDLVPEIHSKMNKSTAIIFFIGVIFMFLLSLLI